MANVFTFIGFNTKIPWIYDDDRGCCVEIPEDILNSIRDLPTQEKLEELNRLAKMKPDWLYDEDYCFYDENFEV